MYYTQEVKRRAYKPLFDRFLKEQQEAIRQNKLREQAKSRSFDLLHEKQMAKDVLDLQDKLGLLHNV